jgi:hypothetical protein
LYCGWTPCSAPVDLTEGLDASWLASLRSVRHRHGYCTRRSDKRAQYMATMEEQTQLHGYISWLHATHISRFSFHVGPRLEPPHSSTRPSQRHTNNSREHSEDSTFLLSICPPPSTRPTASPATRRRRRPPTLCRRRPARRTLLAPHPQKSVRPSAMGDQVSWTYPLSTGNWY